MGRVGGEIADNWRLNTVPSTVIHRVVADPLDGARDVQRGRLSTGSPGGDGGGDEHSGSLPGVRPAPGHGEQDAGLLGAADKPPKTVTTDKWRAYIKPIKDLMPEATHIQSQGLRAEINNNLSERVQGTFRQREKTLRGLDSKESGQRYLDGWILQYNLFRDHESLDNDAPGERAKVKPPFDEWSDVVKMGTTSAIGPVLRIRNPKGRAVPKLEPPKAKRNEGAAATNPLPPTAFRGMPKAMQRKATAKLRSRKVAA